MNGWPRNWIHGRSVTWRATSYREAQPAFKTTYSFLPWDRPRLAERQKIVIKFVFFASDHKQAFESLATSKADAFANDEVQLYGVLAETNSAAEFRVVGDFLIYADCALMFLQKDPEFAEVVERAFHRLAGSRGIVALCEGWFQKPLPSGSRLNLPMSPHLKELFRVQGLPSD